MERSLYLFQNSLKSEKSYKTYYTNLNLFRRFCTANSFDDLTRISPKKLQELLEDYVISLKQRVNPNSVPTYYYPIQSFLECNEIELKWKKIRRLFPAKVKKTGKQAWSTEDIRRMLSVTNNLRNKALILFLASSAVRIGAIEELKIRNLLEMPLNCKAICVYEDSIEEYWTLITPEASQALENYLNKRKQDGEHVTSESPLFRTSYTKVTSPVQRLSVRGASETILRILRKAGLRNNEEKKNGRYNKMPDHAFRKRVITILKSNSKIPTSMAEKIAGHQIYRDETGMIVNLDYSYNVPTPEKLFNFYKHAIQDLTIDDVAKVKALELDIQRKYSALEEEKRKHFEEKKRWYKTILERAKMEGEIPEWVKPIMEEMIQDFES